jgi:ATP-binding cassette subfamily F protein 3
MERVSVGYGERVVLSRLDLTLSNDDRIGLLGSNGNGKSTFAKLLGGRLAPMSGSITRASKLEVGFFAQHQVDELSAEGTPYSHVAEKMRGSTESKIRGRAALIGFSGARAETRISEGAPADGSRHFRRAAAHHPRRADEPSRYRQPRRTDRRDQRICRRLHPGLA